VIDRLTRRTKVLEKAAWLNCFWRESKDDGQTGAFLLLLPGRLPRTCLLGEAIRQCRLDSGADIVIDLFAIRRGPAIQRFELSPGGIARGISLPGSRAAISPPPVSPARTDASILECCERVDDFGYCR
jgi:hypothetical protein